MRKELLFSVGIIVLASSGLNTGFSDEKRVRNCAGLVSKAEEVSIQSYIWMDYSHRDRPLQYWMKIDSGGDVWYVRYDNFNRVERDGRTYPRILESRSGKFSPREIQKLFEFIDKKGFFRMESSYGGEESEVLSEDDILEVCVSTEDGTKSVNARPPSFIPAELSDIVEVMEGKVLSLQEDGRFGVFLRAEALNETRIESLGGRNRFTSFSEEELENHLYIKKAIKNPGQFVHVETWESAEIDTYISKYDFFLAATSDGEFQVDVFLRERLSKVQ